MSKKATAATKWSFAVGSQHGPRSSRWRVSFSEEEVYVSTAATAGMWKVTLHKSGRWHLKDAKSIPGDGKAPLLKTHLEDVPRGHYPAALHIIIPDACLRPASDTDPEVASLPDEWLPRPEHGGIVEVSFIQWSIPDAKEEWPGKSVGTKLLTVYRPTEELVVIGVLMRHLPADHVLSVMAHQRHSQICQKFSPPVILDSPERRGHFYFLNEAKSLTFLEFAVD